jgi:hypothetical protein
MNSLIRYCSLAILASSIVAPAFRAQATPLFVSGDAINEYNVPSDDWLTRTNVNITPADYWVQNRPDGASWVSYDNTGAGGIRLSDAGVGSPYPLAQFVEQFHLLAAQRIGVTVWSIGPTSVWLNGRQIHAGDRSVCSSGPCEPVVRTDVLIAASQLRAGKGFAGANTLVFDVYQRAGGSYGVMYEASAVPEPATMAFIGGGLMAIGGLHRLRRRRS